MYISQYFVRFEPNFFNFSIVFHRKPPISTFMKIISVGAAMLCTDGRTDMTKEVEGFSRFTGLRTQFVTP